MYYLANKFVRLISNIMYLGVLFIPLLMLLLFFQVEGPMSGYELIVWLFVLLLTVVFTLMMIFLIRIYQIIEKWDQLFTIKNASKFLDLGIDGEKYLQYNLRQQDIWRLHEKNELSQSKQSS